MVVSHTLKWCSSKQNEVSDFENLRIVCTGRSTLQKRVMALLRRIEHPTPGNIEVTFSFLHVTSSVIRKNGVRIEMLFSELRFCFVLKWQLHFVKVEISQAFVWRFRLTSVCRWLLIFNFMSVDSTFRLGRRRMLNGTRLPNRYSKTRRTMGR